MTSPNPCPADTYGSPGSCDHVLLPTHSPAETIPPTGGLADTGISDVALILLVVALMLALGIILLLLKSGLGVSRLLIKAEDEIVRLGAANAAYHRLLSLAGEPLTARPVRIEQSELGEYVLLEDGHTIPLETFEIEPDYEEDES